MPVYQAGHGVLLLSASHTAGVPVMAVLPALRHGACYLLVVRPSSCLAAMHWQSSVTLNSQC